MACFSFSCQLQASTFLVRIRVDCFWFWFRLARRPMFRYFVLFLRIWKKNLNKIFENLTQ